MSTPLSFCDISARYGQTPAPRQTIEEQTGWNLSQAFMNYLLKVRRQSKQDAKEDEEDALMAVIDAMNASEKDKKAGKTDMTIAESLVKAGKAINERYEHKVNPLETLTIQAMLACLGDRFTFEQADEIQENTEKVQEQEAEEKERLEVTEARDPNAPENPDNIEKEV